MGPNAHKKGDSKPEEVVVPGRYCYHPADSPEWSGWWWVMLTACAPINTREGHDAMVARLNKDYRGKREWEWEEVLPGDIDYPRYLRKSRTRANVAQAFTNSR